MPQEMHPSVAKRIFNRNSFENPGFMIVDPSPLTIELRSGMHGAETPDPRSIRVPVTFGGGGGIVQSPPSRDQMEPEGDPAKKEEISKERADAEPDNSEADSEDAG